MALLLPTGGDCLSAAGAPRRESHSSLYFLQHGPGHTVGRLGFTGGSESMSTFTLAISCLTTSNLP